MAGSNLPQVSVRLPARAVRELLNVVTPDQVEGGAVVEFAIRISDTDLSMRDLAAFIEFVDHVYGRLSPGGLRSYSRREYGENLKAREVHAGSWELVFDAILANFPHPEMLVLTWLAIKYLPSGTHEFSSAYREYEEGRLARQNRKRIRAEMEADEQLANVPAKQRQQLASVVEELHHAESRSMPRVTRFARFSLKGIFLRVRLPKD